MPQRSSRGAAAPASGDETTASGKGFDADVVGHPFVYSSGDALRVWYTGYQTLRGGVANWKLRIGLADATFALSEDDRRIAAN